MKEFWEERYREPIYAYGERPNEYLKAFLDKQEPGNILLPAEGEGRNAAYAAKIGWKAEAFDYSKAGKDKALALGKKMGVYFVFSLGDYQTYEPQGSPFDVIALTFTHSAQEVRGAFHRKIASWLKPGGSIVLEGFSKGQLGKPSGGPKSLDMLWSLEELRQDFQDLQIDYLEEVTTVLDEGPYHQGKAAVVRMIAMKRP